MSKKSTSAKPRRRVPDAPTDAERVSLHGPQFDEILSALLKVDPATLAPPTDDEDGEDA